MDADQGFADTDTADQVTNTENQNVVNLDAEQRCADMDTANQVPPVRSTSVTSARLQDLLSLSMELTTLISAARKQSTSVNSAIQPDWGVKN